LPLPLLCHPRYAIDTPWYSGRTYLIAGPQHTVAYWGRVCLCYSALISLLTRLMQSHVTYSATWPSSSQLHSYAWLCVSRKAIGDWMRSHYTTNFDPARTMPNSASTSRGRMHDWCVGQRQWSHYVITYGLPLRYPSSILLDIMRIASKHEFYYEPLMCSGRRVINLQRSHA